MIDREIVLQSWELRLIFEQEKDFSGANLQKKNCVIFTRTSITQRLRMRLLPCSLFALWTCAVAASGTTSSTSPEPPLFSQVGSEPLAASASSGRLAACVEACSAQTHVAGAAASDEAGRVREIFMARLRRMELAHQEELAQLHLRIGQLLVAAQRGSATQGLAQVETLGIESQMSSLGQASTPPFPGSRPTQAVSSAASRPWSLRWIHQAGPPESDGRKEKDRATVPSGRNTVLQLGPVASSRLLLQEHEESTDGTCSTDDLMAVQADPVAAVVQLMETNMECALCLIPCGAAANTLGCAVRCIKQARPLSRLDRPSPTACELALCVR